MDRTDASTMSGRGRRSKVARLLEEYDLGGVGAELERRWTATEDRWSLRDLAAYFNQRLLREALAAANVQTVDGEVENIYRLLTDDEVADGDRTRIQRRLEREGVDVEALTDDFVTYQAIRTYLTKHRDAEYAGDETDPLERKSRTIQQVRGRLDSITEGALEGLRETDRLQLGEFHTLVEVQVVCEECNEQLDVVELLERGGCGCSA